MSRTEARTTLRLGTRRSPLAMAQSKQVAQALHAATGQHVELVEVATRGDLSREDLTQIGGTGVFVSALREALLDGAVDIAVHSLKDLPTGPAKGLALAAVPPREDPRDVLIARDGLTLAGLAATARPGRPARVGTGSPRRTAQLNAWARAHRDQAGAEAPPLETVPIRGNVDTRIGRVRSGDLDAVVLARAGLARLGRLDEATEVLDPDVMLPAPGQGALAVECATADPALAGTLAELDDLVTRAAVTAERCLLAALEAGCSAPVGALAEPVSGSANQTELRLRGVVGMVDGSAQVQMSATGSASPPGEAAAALGRELAAEMLAKGAAGLMGERAH